MTVRVGHYHYQKIFLIGQYTPIVGHRHYLHFLFRSKDDELNMILGEKLF
jgi:hypothetical protein